MLTAASEVNFVRTKLFLKLWESIRTSFWFVPSLMILGAVACFVVSISVDYRLSGRWVESVVYLYSGGPEGARALLSTVAGSMMTVTGTVFSVTVVAFTLASQQFSPRLLRNFMRDPGNQFVLGTFMATFVYCLLALRTVQDYDGREFVPHLTVSCAALLAVTNIGVLVYFVHHAASSIQAPVIIDNVAKDLDSAIERLFPGRLGSEGRAAASLTPAQRELVSKIDAEGKDILTPSTGYLQGIDGDHLINVSRENEVVTRVLARPGNFLAHEEAIAKIWPPDRFTEDIADQILQGVLIGHQRTQAQDLEFVFQQLVEVALRALSPGLNDPFTAVACIDRIRDALCNLVKRGFPEPCRMDEKGKLRLITHPTSFLGVLNAVLNPLRQSGIQNAIVTIRLLETIEAIGRCAIHEGDRKDLLRHAQMLERGSRDTIREKCDREDIERIFAKVLVVLEKK